MNAYFHIYGSILMSMYIYHKNDKDTNNTITTQEFKPQGYAPTTMHIPKVVLYFVSFFDKVAAGILPSIGIHMIFRFVIESLSTCIYIANDLM
jgi:hypothetical protein